MEMQSRGIVEKMRTEAENTGVGMKETVAM